MRYSALASMGIHYNPRPVVTVIVHHHAHALVPLSLVHHGIVPHVSARRPASLFLFIRFGSVMTSPPPNFRATPQPRRVLRPAVAPQPVITPRRLVASCAVSDRAGIRSAPRRLAFARADVPLNEGAPEKQHTRAGLEEAKYDEDQPTMISPVDHISCTPSRMDNDQWLSRFGIDVSLLRIYDSDEEVEPVRPADENQHPNITLSRQTSTPTSPVALKETNIESEPFELRSAFPFPATAAPCQPARLPHSPQQQSTGIDPITPRRLHSARSRRQSVKISHRELISLTDDSPSVQPDVQQPQIHRTQPKEPSPTVLSSSSAITGLNVFLTPVRASRKQRLELGADTIVTPVRRSLRLKKSQRNLAPIDHPQARARMLEQFGFSYTPNHSLQ